MSGPDPYWAQVGKAAQAERASQAERSAAVQMRWASQSALMASLSRKKYAGRIRADGKVLCLKCKAYRAPRLFWIVAGGTYLNHCIPCSSRKAGHGK